jgi:DNA-binding transcriptional ArsR family regulator
MARASTTSDVFNAAAEPSRREILIFLLDRERPVSDVVEKLQLEQPAVSKHLRVLRDVGLVRVRRIGRHKLYQTRAEGIKPLHEFASIFERYWSHQLLHVKQRAEDMAQTGKSETRKP